MPDNSDDRLLADLRRLAGEVDAVPGEVTDYARTALGWPIVAESGSSSGPSRLRGRSRRAGSTSEPKAPDGTEVTRRSATARKAIAQEQAAAGQPDRRPRHRHHRAAPVPPPPGTGRPA